MTHSNVETGDGRPLGVAARASAIRRWLIGEARLIEDADAVSQAQAHHLVEAGVPLDRMATALPTLYAVRVRPQVAEGQPLGDQRLEGDSRPDSDIKAKESPAARATGNAYRSEAFPCPPPARFKAPRNFRKEPKALHEPSGAV